MIKVLVIDDSLFMRSLISDMLNSEDGIEVIATARNGAEAIKKIPKIKPDCITLDLAMPHWDGLTTLKHIMCENPVPVVILSAHSKEDADISIECLNNGAVSLVLKPSGELSLDIEKIKDQLIKEVKIASKVKVSRLKSLIPKKPKRHTGKLISIDKIFVIGASTGGPQTLEVVLSSLPSDFPAPIVVVQHMPALSLTESLAHHLDNSCLLPVIVAENNEIIKRRKVYFAPSKSRTSIGIRRTKDEGQKMQEEAFFVLVSEANEHQSSLILSPSVDIVMKSVAQVYNENTIGIILSGMGNDGVEGMKAIKEAGGNTIVQDKSSLIFGMPKAVIDAGYADKVLPASEISEAMLDMVASRPHAE